MKPKIKAGVLMVLCVLLMLGGTGVWAGEEFDAFNINEEEALEYKFKAEDTAYKMYTGVYCEAFAKGYSVYEIVNASQEDTAYIVSSDNMIQIRYKKGDEVISAPISCLARACLSQICVMACDHGVLFDADTKVINTYIFHEMWGLSFYFVTDKGDFVLYKDSIVSETIYLMPESVYRECAGLMTDIVKTTEDGVCPSYSSFMDLTEYQIYPEPLPTDFPIDDPLTDEETKLPPVSNDADTVPMDSPIPEKTQSDIEKSSDVNLVLVVMISAGVPSVILGSLVFVLIIKRKKQ